MRIGLFGGTFNPIHQGHLRAAREVREGFPLDEICLIPSAIPPHKASDDVADAKDRFEMTRMAVSDCPGLSVSDVELRRSGLSYTIDTIHHFKKTLPAHTETYLILGLDTFFEITSWKSYETLFGLIPFIVMIRPGIGEADARTQRRVEDFLLSGISEEYRFSDLHSCYVHREKPTVWLFDADFMNISSTRIRKRIQQGQSVRHLVPEKIETFIQTKGLFL